MKKPNKGFTLIELLVVIAIIGLLSTLAVVALNSARQRSRDAKRVADIRQVQTALELGFSEGNAYPTDGTPADLILGATAEQICSTSGGEVIFTDAAGTVVTEGGTALATCGGTTFMGLVPSNPSPNGAAYTFVGTATGDSYQIDFTLEGATGQLPAGVNCATPDGIKGGAC